MRIFFLLTALLCFTGLSAYDRVYSPPERLQPGQGMLDSVPGNLEYLEMNYRLRVLSNRERPGKSSAAFEVVWNYQSPARYSGVALTWENSDFGSFDDRRFIRADIFEVKNGHRDVIVTKEFDKKVNLADGYNSVSVTKWENRIYVAIGSGSEYLHVGEIICDSFPPAMAGLITFKAVEVVRARLTAVAFPEAEMAPFTGESLMLYLSASKDPVEGYWTYLDRKTDPEVVAPGGVYRLAVVRGASDGCYDIIYVGGADIHTSNWPPMRIKGHLKPSGFVGNYDLEWLDADGYPASSECYAVIEGGALLTVRFPLLNSEIRFRKESLR